MTGPQENRKVPVLVVDPTNEIVAMVSQILSAEERKRWNLFDIERIDDPETVRERIKKGGMPGYAAVFYEEGIIERSGRLIDNITNRAPFLPQVVIRGNKQATQDAISRATSESGAFHAITKDALEKIVREQFLRPSLFQNGTVIKIGGSALDYQQELETGGIALETYAGILASIHEEGKKGQRRRIICTVGAGPRGNIAKKERRDYPHNSYIQDRFPMNMAEALAKNIELMYNLIRVDQTEGETNVRRVRPVNFHELNRGNANKQILLTETAAPYIMIRDEIPLQDSDTQTVALAEFYGIERVILLKRTDGIYKFDPYRGFQGRDRDGSVRGLYDWISIQQDNQRFSEVALHEMIDGTRFSRSGTGLDGKDDGTMGHLMEDSALEYFSKCRYVREIVIVHIAPDELYVPVPGSKEMLRHIVSGEEIARQTDWNKMRLERLKNAFDGRAYSKIVRN